RIGSAPFAPAPRAVRAGDYVFTSSIYPIDEAGHAVSIDEHLGEAGPSRMEVQARRCLETLKSVLRNCGSSLERVLKADVHLADAVELNEFKRVWKEYFPANPPARATVEVGDTLPFPGARLSLDAVALSGDSKLQRQVLSDPEGSDPLAVEWASHAVRAGSFVFCSAFPASDFKNGLAVGKPAGFPNYGSNAEMQADYIFTRMNRVLSQAGTSLEQAVESQLYEPDLLNFHDVDGIWAKYMPVPPPRSSMGVKGLILPGALCAPNLTILVPDKDLRKEESHKGLRWHPVKVRKVNFSPTMKVGPWRFFAGQVPSPDFKSALTVPAGLRHYRSDIEEQTRFTMQILTEQLEANETDWAHCHHVRLYLTEPRRDYRAFARVWREYFPDPARAPALAFVPSTGIMFDGPVIEIDPTCVVRG
ncbi:MAG TPA: RidA family protein, partial [Burkholderiales bacterium]|nr:RidA family protein [Burkholderiales bacterium]